MWLPPTVSRELQEETEKQTAEVMAAAIRDANLTYWTRLLKQIDPDLELIRAHPDARAAGLKPGFYHVMRNVPGAPPSLLPLVGDHGEFVEPSDRMIELLKSADLQNPAAMRERRARDERAARQRAKDAEDARLDRVRDMTERLKSLDSVSVGWRKDAA